MNAAEWKRKARNQIAALCYCDPDKVFPRYCQEGGTVWHRYVTYSFSKNGDLLFWQNDSEKAAAEQAMLEVEGYEKIECSNQREDFYADV